MTIIPIPMTNDIIESAIPLGAGSRRRNIDPEILSGPLYEGKSSVSTTSSSPMSNKVHRPRAQNTKTTTVRFSLSRKTRFFNWANYPQKKK